MDVFYTAGARADLKKLPNQIAQRIVKKVYFFSVQTDPLYFAKALHNTDVGQYRFRVGDYRVVFDVDRKGVVHILMILSIKHRRHVYDF